MRMLVFVALVAACSRDHSVTIFFGATEDKASTGLVCPNENMSLLGQGQQPGQLEFGLVIDVIDFKGAFPTCFPDDLIATCSGSGSPCTRRNRTCIDANITYAASANPVLAAQHELAALPPIDFGATNTPVLVRLTAFVPAAGRSMTPCEDVSLDDPTTPLVGNASIKLVGCTYSCPVILDDVNTLATGLATSTSLTTQAACQTAIAQCAGFPENVASN